MRNINNVIFLFLTSALFWVIPAGASEMVDGKTFFTAANIWYEQPDRIVSTNYHVGTFLPVGTKVKIVEMNDGTKPATGNTLDPNMWEQYILFSEERGRSYKMTFKYKYARSGSSVWDYFRQYFSEDDPMAEGGAFRSITASEQRMVKSGEIVPGMTKKAVIMAYGYPPGHRTPSLDMNKWIYWINRFKKRVVHFIDDKVVEPKR